MQKEICDELDDDEYLNEVKIEITCTCPKCGVSHVMKIFWTGTGTPRKYCRECNKYVKNYYHSETEETYLIMGVQNWE